MMLKQGCIQQVTIGQQQAVIQYSAKVTPN